MLSVRAFLETKVNKEDLAALAKQIADLNSVVGSLQDRMTAAESKIGSLEAAPRG
jgi:hypothetical protein